MLGISSLKLGNVKPHFDGGIDPEGRRLIGADLNTSKAVYAPAGHLMLMSANGGGKTTCGLVPWLLSTIASANRPACLITDSKDGEIFEQTGEMLAEMGVPVALIDPCGVFPDDHPLRFDLNAFGGVVSTYKNNRPDLVFSTGNLTQALVPDPPNDARNQFWRDEQHTMIEFSTLALLKRTSTLATPGGVWSLLANPRMLRSVAAIEAEEGDEVLKPLAQNVLAMLDHEHGAQHRSSALKSLRIFCAGSRLHNAGTDAEITHFDLIRQGYVIFLAGPQAFMSRLGALYALHIMAFNEALYRDAGPLRMLLDEVTNAPLKPMIEAMTTLRAYGGEVNLIYQSRSEFERKFGKLETETAEENCITKIWMGFSSFTECERVSKIMGDELHLQSSLSSNTKDLNLSSQLQLGKQRVMTPAELMAMPADQMLVHVKGLGFFVLRKLSQANLAPYAGLLRPNAREGGVIEPDPKVTLAYPKEMRS